MNFIKNNLEKSLITFIFIIYAIWSACFIYETSFVAVDGKRYFSLFDDAMISMRYAWNFSHGNGLVWNTGEYVQGYTNLLMTLVMSVVTFFLNKPDSVLTIQILGLLFMLAIALLSIKISDHVFKKDTFYTLRYKHPIRLLVCISVLLYYPLSYWSLMGMETGLLTLLLLAGLNSALIYVENNNVRHLYMSAVLLCLAYLTRPDSLIFSFLIWTFVLIYIYKSTPEKTSFNNFKQFLYASGFFFIVIFGQGLFQYIYYGEYVANTYTLKLVGMSLSERLENGTGFILPFLQSVTLLLALSITFVIYKTNSKKLLLLSIVLAAISYQIYVGGDPWVYWRIMSPTMPLAIILAIGATLNIASSARMSEILGKKKRAVALAMLVLSSSLFLANQTFLHEMVFLIRPHKAINNEQNVRLALTLNKSTTQDASIGVFWAGAIPFYTGLRAIDFLGKSDKYISNLPPDLSGDTGWNGMNSVPGHNKYDLTYSIIKLRPTFIQDNKWGTQDLSDWTKNHYKHVSSGKVKLLLLKNSPHVHWHKLN